MKVKKFVTYLIIASFITTSLYSCNKPSIGEISTYKVQKNNFEILVTDIGEISSEIENKIYAPFSTKIDNIIDEGSIVKKQQKIGTLTTLNEEQKRDESELLLKEANLDLGVKDSEILQSIEKLNKELDNAELGINIAKLKLKKLIETRDGVAIVRAEETLKTLDKEIKIYELDVKEKERLNKLGYISEEELNTSKTKLKELQKEKEYTKVSLKVLLDGPRKEEIEKERINVGIAKKSFEKTKEELQTIKNKSKLEKKEKQLAIDKSKKSFDYNSDLVRKGSLISPSDGLIIYGKMMSGQTEIKIKSGDSVSEGVEIAKIVDINKPMLKMLINEVDIGKLKLGQDTRFYLDAYPENFYKGKVIKISNIADNKYVQDDNKVKVFEVFIRIFGKDKLLVPGMTANVEIIVESKKNVLTVPSQAIKREKDKTYCFVKTENGLVKKLVVIDKSNEMETVIKSGLNENELISLDNVNM